MSSLRLALFTACALATTAAFSARPAAAYDWPAYGLMGTCGYGVSGTLYGLGLVPVPPYYALHPPVYYSCPVPRSYGHSPFPYPGTYRTPEIVIGEPVEIVNPYMDDAPAPPPAAASETSAKVASRSAGAAAAPQMIVNPFFVEESDPPSRLASQRLAL